MTDTKLDADLAAYEERHEKLENFFYVVMALCEYKERVSAKSGVPARIYVAVIREAAKELL